MKLGFVGSSIFGTKNSRRSERSPDVILENARAPNNFSLNYHLGKMTHNNALIFSDRVGHERANAEAK